jgi:hypothetical protein
VYAAQRVAVPPQIVEGPLIDRSSRSSNRLELLFAMFELNLKRELTPEERRLLALSAPFCNPDEAEQDDGLAAASNY